MKLEHMYKPTIRKRTLKIIAKDKDSFELHYMGSYQWGLTKQELLKELDRAISIIESWGEQHRKQERTNHASK